MIKQSATSITSVWLLYASLWNCLCLMWKSFVLHENCCIFNKRCLLRMIYHIFKVIQGQNNHCSRFYLETVLFKATVWCIEADILCSWCVCCHYAKLWSLSERRVKDTYEHEYISNCSLLEGLWPENFNISPKPSPKATF